MRAALATFGQGHGTQSMPVKSSAGWYWPASQRRQKPSPSPSSPLQLQPVPTASRVKVPGDPLYPFWQLKEIFSSQTTASHLPGQPPPYTATNELRAVVTLYTPGSEYTESAGHGAQMPFEQLSTTSTARPNLWYPVSNEFSPSGLIKFRLSTRASRHSPEHCMQQQVAGDSETDTSDKRRNFLSHYLTTSTDAMLRHAPMTTERSR